MSDKLNQASKILAGVSDSVDKLIHGVNIKAIGAITPSSIIHDNLFELPTINFPVNPLIGLAESQLSETKKMNETIEALQDRIKELEDKNELANKSRWKHDIFITFVGAFFGFLFSLIILLFN